MALKSKLHLSSCSSHRGLYRLCGGLLGAVNLGLSKLRGQLWCNRCGTLVWPNSANSVGFVRNWGRCAALTGPEHHMPRAFNDSLGKGALNFQFSPILHQNLFSGIMPQQDAILGAMNRRRMRDCGVPKLCESQLLTQLRFIHIHDLTQQVYHSHLP